jgi:predicted dehydrogenase
MYRVAIIGVGSGGTDTGIYSSVGYAHARTYRASGVCSVVAAADVSIDNLRRFAHAFEVSHISTQYQEMLSVARPDIVSIATYAGGRRPIVEACAAAGVRAIWCEKPFCLSMDDGRAMLATCARHNVKLVVNHQRRYLPVFRDAKRLLHDGVIGAPVAFLAGIPDWDLMEWGTHWLDLFRFFADDQPAAWVMGQVRCSGAKRCYGHLQEEHAVAYWAFADGTRGILDGGLALNGAFAMRLAGSDGLIDIMPDGLLRVVGRHGVQEVPTNSSIHGPYREGDDPWAVVLRLLLAWIAGGPEPEVSGRNALLSSELYLAAYESAWRRDRVDLPLTDQASFPLDRLAGEIP